MPPRSTFVPFGPAHLTVIALTVGFPVFFWLTARGPAREPYRRGIRYTLSALLILNWLAYETVQAWMGGFSLASRLPMQLCDWATFTTALALLTDGQLPYELSYFWGLAGTFQAILTPNLQVTFPDPRFISFFVAHCGIVIGVLFLTATVRLRPRGDSLWRVLVWSEVYLGSALLVNAVTGENFGFLSHRPAGRSLLDYLSANHFLYLVEINLLALVFFAILYLPFALHDLFHSAGVDVKARRR